MLSDFTTLVLFLFNKIGFQVYLINGKIVYLLCIPIPLLLIYKYIILILSNSVLILHYLTFYFNKQKSYTILFQLRIEN